MLNSAFRKISVTRKRAIAKALQLEGRPTSRQSFNYDSHAKFEVAQPIRCRLRAFLLLVRYVTLWRSYCDLNIWPYDLEHVSRAPLCSGIVCAKFKLSQATSSWNVTFFTLIRHVTLWSSPWPVELESLWDIWWYVVIVCTKFDRNRTSPAELFTIWQILARVTSHCDLDLWPLDLELLWSFARHMFKLCI